MRIVRVLFKSALIVAAFLFAAYLGLSCTLQPRVFSPIWPQYSVALAALALFGFGYWPAVAVATFLSGVLLVKLAIPFTLLVVIANTSQTLLGAYLLRRFIPNKNPLNTLRDYFLFVVFVALLGTLVSPILGTLTFILKGEIVWSGALAFGLGWWLGQICGVLVVAPLLLALGTYNWGSMQWPKFFEGVVTLLLLSCVSAAVFLNWIPLPTPSHIPTEFLLIPFLLWAAFRLGSVGVSAVILAVTAFTIWNNISHFLPMPGNTTAVYLRIFQLCLSTLAITFASLQAALAERSLLIDRERASLCRVESQRNKIEALFMDVPAAIALVTGPQHQFEMANPTARLLLGTELTGKTFAEVTLGFESKIHPLQLLDEVYRTGVPISQNAFPIRFAWENLGVPEEKYFSFVIRPILNAKQETDGLLLFAVEVTDHAQARKKLELSEEILKKQAQALKASNEELERFAYVTSHDLQEPLRMVSTYVGLLAKRYEKQFDTDGKEFIGFVLDGCKRMKQMIDDLLDYSRLDRVDEPWKSVDCQQLLGGVLKNLQIALEECGGELKTGNLPEVKGDAIQISRLFQNLISNAIKYRGTKKLIINLGAEKQNGHWVFSVADNGMGFSMEYAERVFQIFQRLHSKQEYSGTGIGLSICKKIIERHGGKIWVDSTPQVGSTFYFTLPAVQTAT